METTLVVVTCDGRQQVETEHMIFSLLNSYSRLSKDQKSKLFFGFFMDTSFENNAINSIEHHLLQCNLPSNKLFIFKNEMYNGRVAAARGYTIQLMQKRALLQGQKAQWALMMDADVILKGQVLENLLNKAPLSNADVVSASFINPYNLGYEDYFDGIETYAETPIVNNFRLMTGKQFVPIKASCTHAMWNIDTLEKHALQSWARWGSGIRGYDVVTSSSLNCVCLPYQDGYFIHLGYDKLNLWHSDASKD